MVVRAVDDKKLVKLKKILKSFGSVVVAFSGGVDSTFLLRTALDVLGRRKVVAVIAKSETYPKSELKEALKFVKANDIDCKVINTYELKIKGYKNNPVNRCYFCKKELFSKLSDIKKKLTFNEVLDGTNYDDRLDIRHGRQARDELAVKSPLEKAKITKDDIRRYSKKIGLPTYNKPSFACLASRFPYELPITKRKLERVDKAEKYLKKCGFTQVRVRDYNGLARIEVYKSEIRKFLTADLNSICRYLQSIGYKYVTLDLEGYRTGSMNVLP